MEATNMAERNPIDGDASGASRPPDSIAEKAAYERVEELRQYLSDRQSRRHVIARTTTKSGQDLDWVPVESQTATGIIASPPDEQHVETPVHPDRSTKRATVELELPDAERGPPGTVPVVRHKIDRIMSSVGLQNWLSKSGHGGVIAAPTELFSRSVPAGSHVHAYAHSPGIAYGTEGLINVWQPYVEWSDEFSLGQLWLTAGTSNGTQTIETGLQVRKDSYGDYAPHVFIFFTTNNYFSYGDNIGGFNQDVDGWVQRSSTLFPGAGITRLSTVGGTQYEMDFKVQFAPIVGSEPLGNWWIKVNGEWMGYYPNALFANNGMRHQAENVLWGGEIFDVASHVGTSTTDMGSGLFPWEGFGRAAYMRNLMVQISQAGTMAPFAGWPQAPRPFCYDIMVDPSTPPGPWGYNFFWGGSGRNVSCP
jgi:hypothetical protein